MESDEKLKKAECVLSHFIQFAHHMSQPLSICAKCHTCPMSHSSCTKPFTKSEIRFFLAYFTLSAFPLSQLCVQDVCITMEPQETKERLQRGKK